VGRLTALYATVLILLPACASADPLERWAGPIAEAAWRFDLPESWIRAVMRTESAGAISIRGRPVVSAAGAMGLMQLMPGTWHDMRLALGLGTDPFDPRDNILAGAAYLRLMYDRFGYPGLFAAYNAGPSRFSGALASGRRLPAETRSYVRRVAAAAAAGSPVIVARPDIGRSGEGLAPPLLPGPRAAGLFVRLSSAGPP
jgi:soluble lytic murein transglycosylase-like protein